MARAGEASETEDSDRAGDPTIDELLDLMARAGVDQAVLVPHPPSTFDNAYTIGAVEEHPRSFVVSGKLDVAAPGAHLTARALLDQPTVAGLRLEVKDGRAAGDWLDSPEARGVWDA